MLRLVLLAPLLAALGGCIIYDTKCPDCGWDDDGRPDRPNGGDDTGDVGGDDTATDDSGDVVEAAFVLTPATATPGEVLIGSLTAVDAFDYATVASVEVFGDVTLGATTVRDDEVLLSLAVAEDAVGAADILVHLTDGTVSFVADALTIVAAEGSDPSDGTGSDGTGGDGTGGDGTGGDTSDDCP